METTTSVAQSTVHVPAQWPKHLPSKIVFLAEAPSWEELSEKKPLVGPAGRIFNSLLRSANLDRDAYLITNVFDEKIPDNKIKNWCVGIKLAKELGALGLPPIGNVGYLRPEYHVHLERLKSELLAAQPTVIVPMGGTALWALSGKSNITQMRGTSFAASRLVPGVKIVPTFHPSYIMKKYQHYSIVVRDFQFAYEEAERGKDVDVVRRTLLLSPTLEDVRCALQKMRSAKLLSVDIETGWGQITCIGFAWDQENAICIPFVDQRQDNKCYWQTPEEEVEAWKLVREACALPVPKVGQNFAGYDLMWLLYKHNIVVKNLQDDTRLLSHALYPELPKDLGFLGSSHSSQGAWKYMGKRGDKRDDT